jgi:hypothetical protein
VIHASKVLLVLGLDKTLVGPAQRPLAPNDEGGR